MSTPRSATRPPLTARVRRRLVIAAGIFALTSAVAFAGVWILDSTRTTLDVDVAGLGWGLCVVILATIGGVSASAVLAVAASLLLRERAVAVRVAGGLAVIATIAALGFTAAIGLWAGAWASSDVWYDLGPARDGGRLVVEQDGFFHPWAQLGVLHGIAVTRLDGAWPLPDQAAPLGGHVHLEDGSTLRWTDDAGGITVDVDAPPAR